MRKTPWIYRTKLACSPFDERFGRDCYMNDHLCGMLETPAVTAGQWQSLCAPFPLLSNDWPALATYTLLITFR